MYRAPSPAPQSPHFSGILGLAFPALSAYDFSPLFDNLMAQRLLSRNWITFKLSRYPAQDSALLLGEPDTALYRGPLRWVPVTRQLYWELSLEDVEVAGQRLHLCDGGHDAGTVATSAEEGAGGDWRGSTAGGPLHAQGNVDAALAAQQRRLRRLRGGDGGGGGCRVAVDTGTSMLVAPSPALAVLSRLIRVAPDCSNLADLPSLAFLIGGHRFSLAPEDYVSEVFDEGGEEGSGEGGGAVLPPRRSACRPGFMPLDVPPPRGPLFILGDSFLRKYLAVFDRDGARVGFALANQGVAPRFD